MADRTYTKEDLEKYLKIADDYVNSTEKNNAFENLFALGENGEEEGLAVQDLQAFIDGSLEIDADAYDTMKTFIDTFARGYSNPKIQELYNKAMAKLNKLKAEKEKTQDGKTETVKTETPDLTKLNLHMRNSSETAAIVEEELKQTNSPDDRFNSIFQSIVDAYRTGVGIESLNDLIQTEADVEIAKRVKNAVEYDNAGTVPMIEKEVVSPHVDDEIDNDKIKEAADRIIALIRDVENQKGGRLDSIQKEMSALNGAETGALYKEVDGRDVSGKIKDKFKTQLVYNLEDKFLTPNGEKFEIKEGSLDALSAKDREGYLSALDGIKEKSYNKARVDVLYDALGKQTEKAQTKTEEKTILSDKENRTSEADTKEETALPENFDPEKMEFTNLNDKEKAAEDVKVTPLRTYTKEDLEKYLKTQEEYLKDPEKSNAFEDIHEVALEDLNGFIDGTIAVAPDAYDVMDEFIDTFADGYKDPKMQELHRKAKEKLAHLKETVKTEEVIDLQSLDGKYKDRESVAVAFENWDHNHEVPFMHEIADTLNLEDKEARQAKLQELQDKMSLEQSEEVKHVMDDSGYMYDTTLRQTDDRENFHYIDVPVYGTKESRERQSDNFDNDITLNLIELEVLLAEGKISQNEYDTASDTFKKLATVRHTAGIPQDIEAILSDKLVSAEDEKAAFDLIEKNRDQMRPKQLRVHEAAIIENLWNKLEVGRQNGQLPDDLVQLFTPEIISKAITHFENKPIDDNYTQNDKQLRLQTLSALGNGLVSDIEKSQGYYYTDITNAADEYDGYKHLIEKLSSNDDYKDQSINYEDAQKQMDQYVTPYDQLYSIPNGHRPVLTAERLVGRINKAVPVFDTLEFNEQTLGKDFIDVAANFKFATEYDDNGNPIAFEECIKNGEVVKGSSLETLLKFAANDVMLQKLNTADEITADVLLNGAKDQAYATMFAYANAEETIQKGLRENPDKFKDPQYLQDFTDRLKANQATVISPLAVNIAQKREANKVETYTNRLKSKLGAQNVRYIEPVLLGQVAKIDKSSHFNDNSKAVKRKALTRQIGGLLTSGAIAYGMSYGMTKLAAKYGIGALATNTLAAGGAVSWGAELAVGTPKAAVYALGGAAVATLGYYVAKKISARKNGQKYRWKEFKEDAKSPQFISAVTAGALSGASLGYAFSGCPKMAAACGYGAMTAAGVGRAISSYRDMRLSGHKKGAAIAMAAVNAAVVPLAGHFGRLHAMQNQPLQTVTETANEAKTQELYDDPVKRAAEGWTSDPYAGPGNGYLVDHESVGPYHNYDADAMAHSLTRSDGIRFSEFLNHGQGGLHVQPDYQNGLGGLMHDATLHDNAIDALNALALKPGNEWMNSFDSSTGVVSPNSEILFYKLYQQAVLHPNDSSVMDTFKSLLQGNVDPAGLGVIRGIEDKTSVLGHVLSDHNSFSYKTNVEPGYDLVHSVKDIYAKFTRGHVLESLSAAGALIFEGVRKVKDKLRPGRKADRINQEEVIIGYTRKKVIDNPKKPYVAPTVEVIDIPQPEPTPQPEPKPNEIDPMKIMMDEYKIVYGHGIVSKSSEEAKQHFKDYYKRVEEERKVEAPDMTMEQYLLTRREKLDQMLTTKLGEMRVSVVTGPALPEVKYKADYQKRMILDTRPGAAIIAETRQSLMQSNLSPENLNGAVTLTHFMKYMDHFIAQDEVVADGSRRASLNPQYKEKYKKDGSQAVITDLNAYLIEGKPLKECQEKTAGRDLREKQKILERNQTSSRGE